MTAFIRDTLVNIGIAVLIFLGVQATIQSVVVQQHSMTPTLEEGQFLFVNKAVYFFSDPGRGDIIVFHPPDNAPAVLFIKRIIGLPGETIEINSGIVYVDGYPLEEPYIKYPPQYKLEEFIISEQQYFVLGDNRNNSMDSHNGWTVSEANILGKAWVSVWPPRDWGLAPNYAYASN